MSDIPVDNKTPIELTVANPFDEAFQTRFKHWLKDGMQVQARETYYILYKIIDQDIYQNDVLQNNRNSRTGKKRYNTRRYERSFDFREAVSWEIKETTTFQGKSGYETRVFIDPNKIHPKDPPAGYGWGQHKAFDKAKGWTDRYSDKDGGEYTINEWIVEWVENGQESRLFSYAGIKALERTNEWAEKNMPERIRQRMEIESDLNINEGRTGLYVNVLKGGKPRFV